MKLNGHRGDAHIDDNALAALADHGPDAVEADVIEHMAHCPRCTAAWAAAARRRGAELSGATIEPAPPALMRAARAMAPAPATVAGRRVGAAWIGASGMLVAAVLALVLLLPDGELYERPTVLTAALQAESSHGMIFPGVTEPAREATRTFRSGGQDYPGLDALIGELVSERVANPGNTVAARELILGWIASDRLEMASDMIARERAREPGDRELRHLDAIVSWRLSRLDQARALLTGLVADDRDDEIARFNLALLQHELGPADQGYISLRELSDGAENAAVRQRARAVIEG